MINTAEILSVNYMLTEMGSHETIRKYLLIELYGVKYTVLRIKSVDYHEKVDKKPLFITVIEVGLYVSDDQLIGEYAIPVSETKLISIARSVKNAFRVWKRHIEEVN